MGVQANVTIRPTRTEDEEATIAIYNRVHHDLPPMSVATYRAWVVSRPEGVRLERFVAEHEGTIVGSYDLREVDWAQRRHTWFAYLEVDATYRHRGVGSMLYQHLLATATRESAARIYGLVRDDLPDALAFVERRGCLRTGRVDRMSRLDVSTANLTGFRAADERVRREGIKIKTLEELGVEDERLLHQIHEVESRSAQDIPSTQGISEDPYDEWAQRVLQGEGRPPSCFWIALDGDRPVGIARLTLRPQAAAFNGYTGVDRAYRGRGIAKALKLRTVEWARENGIRYIYTGNDAENHAMLAVNVALGYTPVSRQLEVIKELAHEHPATA